jgi:hypothetical protein
MAIHLYTTRDEQAKARIVEQIEVVIAKQWHRKHVSGTTDGGAAIEDAVHAKAILRASSQSGVSSK